MLECLEMCTEIAPASLFLQIISTKQELYVLNIIQKQNYAGRRKKLFKMFTQNKFDDYYIYNWILTVLQVCTRAEPEFLNL